MCLPGHRIRMREIVREGSHGGRRCPHVQETKVCEYPPCYFWRTRTSSECRMNYQDMQCGEGMRNKTSECISVQGVSFYFFLFDRKVARFGSVPLTTKPFCPSPIYFLLHPFSIFHFPIIYHRVFPP